MRIVLVTSELTYTPHNYLNVLSQVLVRAHPHIVAVVLVRYPLMRATLSVPYLLGLGCAGLATTLARNVVSTLRHSKSAFLSQQGIPTLSVSDINEPAALAWLRDHDPELVVNMRSRCIFTSEILSLPTLGCVNVHHGLLPGQRGLFCDLHSLARHELTGFTIHTMTEAIDAGDILYQEHVAHDREYMRYLEQCAAQESEAIGHFIQTVVTSGRLPQGEAHVPHERRPATTTPTARTIRSLIRSGVRL